VAAREKEIRLNTESQTKLQVRVPEAEVAEAKAQRYLEVVQRQQGLGEKAGILKENRAKTQLAVETAEKRVIERGELEPKALRFEALIGILKEHDRLRGLDESRLKLQGQLTASLEEEKGLQKDLGGIELPDHAAALAAVQRALVAFREAEQGHYTQREAWSGEQKARTGEQAKLTHERKALETKLRENQSLIAAGKCPKCGQPTTESLGDLLRDIQQEIEQALARESEFDAATKVIDARQAESLREFELRVEQARKDHGEAQTREQFAKEQAARAKSKQEDLTRKQQQIQKLQEQLAVPSAYSAAQHGLDRQEADGLREAHARFQAVKTAPKELADAKLALEAAEKEFAAAQKEFNDLKAERATLPFEDVTKAQLAIDDHTKLKVELGTLKGTLEGLTRSLTDVKRRLTAAQKAVADHAERKQKIEETKGQVNLNDATSKLLNQCRTSLNDQTKPELELRASLNLQHLTSGRYSNLKLDKDWGAILIDEDEKQKDVISGGEEDIVALALRLALSELIQERQGYPLSLLILDEVFGSLDAARRGAVLDRLVFLKDRFQQILVISHIEGINELADQCIFVVRDPQTKASRVSETGFDRPTDLLSLASEGDSLDF
ncbi:MAG: SbcC/MukB-like Walker B domain-containing protein, partial [Fimbriimonas sp.]